MYEEVKQQPYRTEGRPVSAGLHQWYLSAPGNQPWRLGSNRLPDGFRRRLFVSGRLAMGRIIALDGLGLGIMIVTYWIGGIRSERTRKRACCGIGGPWGTCLPPCSSQ